MITVDNIALKWDYADTTYTHKAYKVTADLTVAASYRAETITLTEEQTAQLIATIMDMIRENVSVKHVAAPDLIDRHKLVSESMPDAEAEVPLYERAEF